MLNLVEKENTIIRKAKKANSENRKVYIYGCGEMGKNTCNALVINGIRIEGFLVDEQYYTEKMQYKEIPVLNIDRLEFDPDSMLIIAMRDYDRNKVSEWSRKIEVISADIFSLHTVEDFVSLNYDYIKQNEEKFLKIYEEFSDEKSRECMTAYLNQKISGEYKYLENIWESNQYYDKDIVDFSKIESFVDCGAYDGDSFFAFLKNYQEMVGKEYAGISFLLEPDEENYKKLLGNCAKYEKCNTIKLGAWDKKDTLTFSIGGTSSGINKDGCISINVDAIDNIVEEQRVDFIKMDIEGSELNALKGAEKTIKAYRPILAICVYHKKEDLLTIPQYIKSLCSEYKFYLRAYSKYTQELVLYAV